MVDYACRGGDGFIIASKRLAKKSKEAPNNIERNHAKNVVKVLAIGFRTVYRLEIVFKT